MRVHWNCRGGALSPPEISMGSSYDCGRTCLPAGRHEWSAPTILIVLSLFLSTAAHATVVLDDFATFRQNHNTGAQDYCNTTTQNPAEFSNCLWPGQPNQGPTICAVITPGSLTCNSNAGVPANGLGFWLNTLDCDSSGCYDHSTSFMHSYIKSGTWNPLANRYYFSYKCSVSVAALPGGASWLEIGTYIRPPGPMTAVSESGQGQHYYQNLNSPSQANEWVNVELNRTVQHLVGLDPNINWPEDPEWNSPTQIPASGSAQIHYFDGLTHFYFGPTYAPEMQAQNLTCSFGPMTLDYVTGEPDAYVSNISGTYNPNAGHYDLSWNGPKHVVGGVTYDVRYSPSSMHTNGWSSGTSAGSVTGQDDSPYTAINYTSPSVPRAAVMYFAIRPRMSVASITVSGTIHLQTHVEHFLSAGDAVTISNVCPAANGNHTITVIDTVTVSLDGTSGSCAYTSGGTITATDNNKNFAEFQVGGTPSPSSPPPGNSPPPGSNPPTTTVTPSTLNVRVYPNPWRSDKHGGHPSITFDGLTIGTTIKIFTVSGHKVKVLKTDARSIPWDLTNDAGDKVASGVYVYLITDSQGDKVKGKVAVIK